MTMRDNDISIQAEGAAGGTESVNAVNAVDAVRDTVALYAGNRPALGPILETFQGVLEARAGLLASFATRRAPRLAVDTSRSAQGVPLLADVDLAQWAEWLDESWRVMLPALEKAMPQGEGFGRVREALEKGDVQALDLANAYVDRTVEAIAEAARKCDVEPALLLYAVETFLGPVLGAMSALATEVLSSVGWKLGTCPVCGSFPSVAYLMRAETTELDALVGGGGQKRLHCSLCGHEWRYRRDACPACDNTDPGTRRILHEEDHRYERVEACTKCQAYFPCVDLREMAVDPDMHVVPLGLMHLDVVARKEGFHPLAPAPWNTPDDMAS